MSEYIEFVETKDTGKTKVFAVRSLNGGANLGEIRWYPTWRQYVFMPARVTVWNPDCLNTIITFINGLMMERASRECTGGLHVYRMVAGDKSAMKCERCGKPYSEYDAL